MITITNIFDSFGYIRRYGWRIVFFLAMGAWAKSSVIDPQVNKRRQKQSYLEATNPDRVSTLQEDMRKVREAQQKEATKKAIEAEEERKKKEAELKKKKQIKLKETGGRTLGSPDEEKKDFAPLLAGSSYMQSYRPARRRPNRGG